MIHIATTHHGDPRFAEIQAERFRRHTGEPYRLYAYLHGSPEAQRRRFDFVLAAPDVPDGGLSHVDALNALAAEMLERAEPGDAIVFTHGDTFPIAEWTGRVREMLASHPLAAVQRRENMEPTAHECFCATTAGFWDEIDGRWGTGPEWDSAGRRVTDTSAALWEILERRQVDWLPILRTNARDLHPVWFAVYGEVIYHHGAGFRPSMSRRDAVEYAHLPPPLRNIAGVRRRIANERLSRRFYRRVASDDRFHLELTGGEAGGAAP
jgi:hypothetical protein